MKRSKKNNNDESNLYEKERKFREKQNRLQSLEAKTESQGYYISSILTNIITFGVGSAGTGKTFCATSLACEAFQDNKIDKIIITRPAVESGESLGFLPGELEEKYDPYLKPVRAILDQKLGRSQVDYFIKSKKIEAIPLAYMRGESFNDCWVILDEAQNTSFEQMKMFLTRIGRNCKAVINGDPSQTDIDVSGLNDAVLRLSNTRGVAVVEFSLNDCVRSKIVKDILKAYR